MIKRALILGTVATFILSVPAAALDTAFSYQGRLSDAGSPADGDYDFQFILYTAEIGGSQVGPILYGDDVQVIDGYFTIFLDFGAGVFDGSALWIEVQVKDGASTGGYTPLAPRQAVMPSPYSLYSGTVEWGDIEGMPPGFADGTDDGSQYQAGNQLDLTGDTFDVVEGAGSGLDADTVDGQQATAFAASSHLHSGTHITTGTVADARIASTIARDSEIMPTVLANDGPGSGLDADTIDGESATAFANSSHNHSGSHIITGTVADARIQSTLARDTEVMPIVLASDGPGSGLNADMLDGHSTSYFERNLTIGDGLDLDIYNEISVDPTEFNGSVPIGSSSGNTATASSTTWVQVDAHTITAPSDGEVLLIGFGWISCESGCSGLFGYGTGVVGFGISGLPPLVGDFGNTFSSESSVHYEIFTTTTVSESSDYSFRVYMRRSPFSFSSSATFEAYAKLIYVFIPD